MAPLTDSRGNSVGGVVRVYSDGHRALALLDVRAQGIGSSTDAITRSDFENAETAPLGEPVGFLEIFVSADGITHPYSPYVLFDGAACSGNPRLSAAATRPAQELRAAVVGTAMDLFVASSPIVEQTQIVSIRDSEGCRDFRFDVDTLSARHIGALSNQLALPLHWN